MKNKLWLMVGLVISILLASNLASAFCVITFYTNDEDGNLIKSDLISGACQDLGKINYIKYQAGGAFSWSGVFDTCYEKCGKVKINASIYEQGKLIMYGEKELNNDNTNGWNSTDTKFFNLTLKYVDSEAKSSGSGSSRIVPPSEYNPTNVQTVGPVNLSKLKEEKKEEDSKHLNNLDDSKEQSIIKDWMIYGIIGFVVVLGILAFLFFRSKEMGGKI